MHLGPTTEQLADRRRCIAEMNKLAREIDRRFNGADRDRDRKTGFVLLVFPFGPEGHCNFISNGVDRADVISNGADRADIVVLFREMIARLEGQPEMSQAARDENDVHV